jgi:2-dehydropantoate 2-reductase
MRIVVYGVGAIGGTVAASLALAGIEVAGIARGAMLEAIRTSGLRLRTPLIDERVELEVYASPAEIAWRDDDVVLLTMKSQDTAAALTALRDAGVEQQAIVCGQNGIENERMALRLFPNVYGMTVMCPGTYTTPGEVLCHAMPKRGMLDIGRYPLGADETARALAAALEAAEFKAFVLDEVMQSKHGKLLENQVNIVRAAFGPDADSKPFDALLKAEGEAVYRAAGIEWMPIGGADPRRHGVMEMGDIPGAGRGGDSSSQSLLRGTGSIETDYLNGEIALLGRLHGVSTPVNAWFTALGARMVREGLKPGSVTPAEVESGLRAAGVDL